MQFLTTLLLSAALAHAQQSTVTKTTTLTVQPGTTVYSFPSKFACKPPLPRAAQSHPPKETTTITIPGAHVAARTAFLEARATPATTTVTVTKTTTGTGPKTTVSVDTGSFVLKTDTGFAYQARDSHYYFNGTTANAVTYSLVSNADGKCQLYSGGAVVAAPQSNPAPLGGFASRFSGFARCGIDRTNNFNLFYCQQSQKDKLMVNYLCQDGVYALAPSVMPSGCSQQVHVTAVPVQKN